MDVISAFADAITGAGLPIPDDIIADGAKQGKIRPIKLGTRTLIPESELQRLVTEQLEWSAGTKSAA
jgi:hypothetical protein